MNPAIAMLRRVTTALVVTLGGCCVATADASVMVFFDSSQVATPVESGATWDTIYSSGYLFTYTRDKLFTGGTGHVIGRPVRVPWPDGVEAQAVTTPPPGLTDYKARITIQRADGDVFDVTSFTAKLLANTAGAGGAIEIMPMLNGEDAFNDPLYFDATGYYGGTFSYDESPNPWGSTATLKAFDAYKIGLYVDFAITALALDGAQVNQPPGDYNQNYVVDAADFVVWRKGVGSVFTQDDYNVWLAHFGQTAGSSAALPARLLSGAVPEPACMLLFLSAGAVGSCRTRRFLFQVGTAL